MNVLGKITLRKAIKADAQFLYTLRLNPEVCEASLHPPPNTYEEHLTWFHNSLKSKKSFIYIALLAPTDARIGQVRVDANGEISLAILPEYRNKGYAQHMITTAMKQSCIETGVDAAVFFARVKDYNKASLRAFEKCGFVMQGNLTMLGSTAIVLKNQYRTI